MGEYETREKARKNRWIAATVLFSVFGLLLAPKALLAQDSPGAFVQQEVDQGIRILADKTLGVAERKRQIEALLTATLDLRRMALFALGAAAQGAPPADVEAYVDAYRTLTLASYEAQFGSYVGQVLEVKGATSRTANDYVVAALVVDPGDKTSAPIAVDFRVIAENGKFAVVDAAVEGVWLTLAQREEFTDFLRRNGGSIPKLVERLHAMAVQSPTLKVPP